MTHDLSNLSIIIVTWRGDAVLADCLDSLSASCGAAPEIVVVDNDAAESTRELVARYANAKYLASPGNPGFAGGNNLGLRACSRPFILLLNNDTVVHEEPFSQLIGYLDEHPEVGAVQGTLKLVQSGDFYDECGSRLSRIGELADTHRLEPMSKVVATHPVYHAKGACLLFRREALDCLGGVLFYDHFRSYGEDTDFCHRLWLAGYEVHYVAMPAVDHRCGVTAAKLPRTEIEAAIIANRVFSFLVNFGWYGYLRILLPLLAVYIIRCVGTTLLGNFGNAKIYFVALASVWRRRVFLAPARRQVQSSRRISDREWLKKVG